MSTWIRMWTPALRHMLTFRRQYRRWVCGLLTYCGNTCFGSGLPLAATCWQPLGPKASVRPPSTQGCTPAWAGPTGRRTCGPFHCRHVCLLTLAASPCQSLSQWLWDAYQCVRLIADVGHGRWAKDAVHLYFKATPSTILRCIAALRPSPSAPASPYVVTWGSPRAASSGWQPSARQGLVTHVKRGSRPMIGGTGVAARFGL